MSDEHYRSSLNRAIGKLIEQTPNGPEWEEIGMGRLAPARRPQSRMLAVGGAMALALVVVGGVLVLLDSPQDPAEPSPVSVVPSTIATPATTTAPQPPSTTVAVLEPPNLEVDAPEGRYTITHLRAVVSGRVDPGATVTVGGVPVAVEESDSSRSLGATFEHELWLELGENFVPVTATGPGGNTTWSLRPTVIPAARTRLGLLTLVGENTIEFDPVEIAVADDPDALVKPPTLTMLGQTSDGPRSHTIDNSSIEKETLPLDARVDVILTGTGLAGPVNTVLAAGTWRAMWEGIENDTDYYGAASPGTLYWVTTHNGVVVQVHQYSGSARWGAVTGPIFGSPADVVLLFDDGIDGVLAVDPDKRVAARSVIDGHAAGDPPYRLIRVDDYFVIGWGGIFASNIASREAIQISDATIFLPATEPGLVWMVDYPSGSIQGTPDIWLTDLAGRQITEPTRIDVEGFPAIGIPGGVAIETDVGVALWDAASGAVSERLGTQRGFVSDSHGSLLAWCDTCTELHITNVDTLEDIEISSPTGRLFNTYNFGARSARFSPDGRYLAVLAGSSVVLIDTQSGDPQHIADLPGAEPSYYFGWTADSGQLYVSSYSYGLSETLLVRADLETGAIDYATLPFGGALSFVVLTPEEAEPYLADDARAPADCPPVGVQPSGREGICGFRF